MIALLTGLGTAAALLPLWSTLTARAPALVRIMGPVMIGLAMALVATFATPAEPAPKTNRPTPLLTDGYVGSAACRSCHPGEHASWHDSFHRTMTQAATRENVRADLGGDDRIELDFHGQQIVFEWSAGELWVELGSGRKRPVVQLTGSHHAQVFWYATGNGRELAAAPLVYRIAERRWLPVNAVFLMPPDVHNGLAPGEWNRNCMSCHATHSMPRLVGGTDTRVAELGIACEACHGPGQEHTTQNRNPLRRYGLHFSDERDETTVQPERLTDARRSEVCGQCHSVNIVRKQHFDTWAEDGSPFRPGQPLDAAQLVVTPAARGAPELQRIGTQAFFDETFWPDGQVRATGREFNGLIASPCHADGHGDRSMTCMSCHDLHQESTDERPRREWANAQLAAGMRGDAACTQCHPEFADEGRRNAHTHHGPGVTCYDCHMPRTAYGLLKAVRSHTVTSPDVHTELRTGRPNACSLCHLDQTLAWTGEHLENWYGGETADLSEDQRTIAAGPLWLLTGDAAQRVLVADSAGWEPAQRAAGTRWMTPYLAQLLADPYYAVRYIAARSLGTITAVPDDYDFLGDRSHATAVLTEVNTSWLARRDAGWTNERVLIGPDGVFRTVFSRLLAARDDRKISIKE